MTNVKRITPAEARVKVQSGAALLVCAYESEELCRRIQPEGAILLDQFKSRLPTLGKTEEIIFYCA